MTAVRIDTLRNRIAAAIDLLQRIHLEAEDLHTLAYDRKAALEEIRVAGGSTDYALDTNGDRRARDAYRLLGDALIEAVDALSVATHNAITVLRSGDTTGRRSRRSVTALELAEAFAARARRQLRSGDYTAIRALPQPERDLALKVAVTAYEQADQDCKILEAKVASLEQQLAEARPRHRRHHRDASTS